MLLKCDIRDKIRWSQVAGRVASPFPLFPPFGTARGPSGEGAVLGGSGGDTIIGEGLNIQYDNIFLAICRS